ncbi:hypothetical protein P20311_0758 [Pseudoalteromonas sp. BSi20311]|nr:hypothetical protein P20311_0758 [Pseudoalteromonas sp. BSi20311]
MLASAWLASLPPRQKQLKAIKYKNLKIKLVWNSACLVMTVF